MIIFFLMNLVIAASSFLLTSRIIKYNNFVDSLLSFLIFCFAQIVFTELLLGIFGILNLGNLILLNLGVLWGVYLITRNKKNSFGFIDLGGITAKFLNSRIQLLFVSVILAFGLIKVCINLNNPPFGWDSLNYHFTFPVEWLKHGNLLNPITIFDDPSPSYYPINGSLMFLWLIFPLKNVFLADLGQIPFFILALLAVYNIARKIGLNRDFSFYASALFLLIPNFFKQLEIAYVDVMVAALFLACINFLFLLNKRFVWQNILLYSLSLGMLLGTKTVALPYSVLLFIPFVYLAIKKISKFYLFLASILIIIIFGGFSYLRNLIVTGNPLYPLNFTLFGQTVFSGVMDRAIYSSHFKAEDYALSKLLFHEGLGVQSIIFILPSIVLALPITLIKRRKNINFNLAYFLILPFLMYLVYRYVIPLANPRYLYPLLGMGVIMGFYLVDILKPPKRVVSLSLVICLLASISELAKRQELIASIALTILFLFLSPLLIKTIKQVLLPRRLVISSVLAISLFSLVALEKSYKKNEYPRYTKMVEYSGFWPDATRAWEWLNQNTTGNNIAYIGRPVPFPLYGSRFKNNVYYVSVNKTDPPRLHDFKDSHYSWGYDFSSLHENLKADGNYRSDANYSVWLTNLQRRKTDYLFIYSLHQTMDIEFPIEDKWASFTRKKFTPVFSNETIHIYKVISHRL